MLKNIFSDIILLYKNFFFWFKIKFFAFIFGMFLGFVMAIPSSIVIIIYYWNIGVKDFSILQITPELLDNYFLVFLVFLTYFTFIVGFLYSYIFLAKFYLEFREKGKKFEFKLFKNFFNTKNLKRFFNISIIITTLFLGIFVFLFYIYSEVVNIYEFKGSVNLFFLTEKINGNIHFISLVTIPIFLGILYLIYKIIFSFAFMLDKETCTIRSIKLSFKQANFKKFIKTLFVLIIILFPFLLINQTFIKTIEASNKLGAEAKIYLDLKKEKNISEEKQKIFETLDLKYFGANENDLKKIINQSFFTYLIIKILDFLLIYGVFTMIYISIYKHIIKEKND